MPHILAILQRYAPKTIRDIGCGSGRCLWVFAEGLSHAFAYTGVDFSPSFIELARQHTAQSQLPGTSAAKASATFVCQDMLAFIEEQAPQSTDAIVGLASIQHLFSQQERARFFVESYRTLAYGGTLILVNRSFSDRFLSSYPKACMQAFLYRALSLGMRGRNDIFIPRKDSNHQANHQVFSRFYHIFMLTELRRYALQAGFTIEELCYIDTLWQKTSRRRTARNSFLVARKTPIHA